MRSSLGQPLQHKIILESSIDFAYRGSQFGAEPPRPEVREQPQQPIGEPQVEDDEPLSLRHMWPLVIGVLFLGGVSMAIATLVKTYAIDPCYGNWTLAQYREDNLVHEDCKAVERPDPLHNDCQACPASGPDTKIFAAFWESQSNCQRLVADASNRYITHVIWSFAEPLEDGTVKPKLQFWRDQHIKDCILQLRMRCIKQIVAIGGASFRERFLTLKDPPSLARFKTSAMQLVQEYDFDGIDIDDETANMKATDKNWTKNHAPTVLNYLHALREGFETIQKPDEPKYLLSWDEFPFAWDIAVNEGDVGCENYDGDEGWHRCFEPRITSLVDFVNIMFYNINGSSDELYVRMMNTTLPNVVTTMLPTNKIVLGVCAGSGCVKEQPKGQDVYNAGNGSAHYGGTMLWSATIDILYENATAINRMGRAGSYGVKLPFRSPPT
ncbi:hypothetical protein AeRB84_009885 [Aphanomyces euteiches]|nr:hypothetical protein AeRB84_009885 [Aphanomyces euteiches]